MMKRKYRLWSLLIVVLFLTSCSLTDFLKSSEPNTNSSDVSQSQSSNGADTSNINGELEFEGIDKPQADIDLVVVRVSPKDELEDSLPVAVVVNPDVSRKPDLVWSVKLFFADRDLVMKGKPGPYGFVTPAIREVPVTTGILKYTLNELIKGPTSGEENLGSVLPPTVTINKLSIQDRIAVIDFDEALLTDHPGGTLGGSITMQALVFTATQFDSIDGVLVTVEGEPWDDGHFIWDTPIYERDLLNAVN